MLEALGRADRWLLLKINRDWSNSFLDAVLPELTDLHKAKWFAWFVGPALLGWWLWRGRKHAVKIIVVAALAVGSADLVAHRVIKPLVGRQRPSVAGISGFVRSAWGSSNSFPSNHAANAGAAAAVLATAYPAWTLLYAFAAFVVAYSRVYCGVHYPGDVIAGLLLGVLLGKLWAGLMLGGGMGGSGGAKKKKR